jgi:hypothetical protein
MYTHLLHKLPCYTSAAMHLQQLADKLVSKQLNNTSGEIVGVIQITEQSAVKLLENAARLLNAKLLLNFECLAVVQFKTSINSLLP